MCINTVVNIQQIWIMSFLSCCALIDSGAHVFQFQTHEFQDQVYWDSLTM